MKKNVEEEKVDFDLSKLTLEELVEVYDKVEEFIDFLKSSKTEEAKENEDE